MPSSAAVITAKSPARCTETEKLGALARISDRVFGEVLGHHTQHSRTKRDLDKRITVRTQFDPSTSRTVGEVVDHLLEDGQRHGMAERHDLDSALELGEEEDFVDQRAGVLDLISRLIDQRANVGAR